MARADWQATAWILARRFPQRWGRGQPIQSSQGRARAGRTPEELGRQFEPSAQTIRNWLRQADREDDRRTDGLTTEEREEVRRLRRENKTLREEREILKKAAARFARETGSIPAKDSSSWRRTRPSIPSPRRAESWVSPPAKRVRF